MYAALHFIGAARIIGLRLARGSQAKPNTAEKYPALSLVWMVKVNIAPPKWKTTAIELKPESAVSVCVATALTGRQGRGCEVAM
jgi:hypothetical protein